MKSTYSADNIAAIIPAAGQGTRMGGQGNKLFLELAGTPILILSLKTMEACPLIAEIIVPAAKQDISAVEALIRKHDFKKSVKVIEGGPTRQDSVFRALWALSPGSGKVLIHDGARPLLTVEELNAFLATTRECAAAVMAVRLKDTVKEVDGGDWVKRTPERDELRAVQTPQIFDRFLLEKVHKLAAAEGFKATDDASILEWQNHKVKIFPGSYENIKITTPEDLLLAEAILQRRNYLARIKHAGGAGGGIMRIGIGYDVHALKEGKELILGGVKIPHHKGLEGHSDADVLTHAVMDAILGAAAFGDLGFHFPDSDKRYKGISSLKLLGEVYSLIEDRGYRIENLDSIVIAQKPKIAPYIEQMRSNLAEAVKTDLSRISVKATTTEYLGFEGREEGISAQSVVCLRSI